MKIKIDCRHWQNGKRGSSISCAVALAVQEYCASIGRLDAKGDWVAGRELSDAISRWDETGEIPERIYTIDVDIEPLISFRQGYSGTQEPESEVDEPDNDTTLEDELAEILDSCRAAELESGIW